MYLTTAWFFLKRMPKLIVLVLNLVVIFLTIFLLLGCYNLSNISTFLVRYEFNSASPFYPVIEKSFSQANTTNSMAGLERVKISSGYMGVCVTNIPDTYGTNVTSVCYPRKDLENTTLYTDLSVELFNVPSSGSPNQLGINLNILELAEATSRNVVHPYILMATVAFSILTFFMVIYITLPYLPFKYHALRVAVACSALLVLLWGIGVMWTHVGAHACSKLVPDASMGILKIHKGLKAALMSWISFAFLLVDLCIVWLSYLRDRKNLSEEIDKVNASQSAGKYAVDSSDSSTLHSKF